MRARSSTRECRPASEACTRSTLSCRARSTPTPRSASDSPIIPAPRVCACPCASEVRKARYAVVVATRFSLRSGFALIRGLSIRPGRLTEQPAVDPKRLSSHKFAAISREEHHRSAYVQRRAHTSERRQLGPGARIIARFLFGPLDLDRSRRHAVHCDLILSQLGCRDLCKHLD